MEITNRKTINDSLNKYCYLSNDDSNYIEITEWSNGEGYDINIYTKNEGTRTISLTRGEIDAIDYLVKSLAYNEQI